VKAGDPKKAAATLANAYKQLDLAGKKNVIHKNKASRTKSRLTKMVARMSNTKAKIATPKDVAKKAEATKKKAAPKKKAA